MNIDEEEKHLLGLKLLYIHSYEISTDEALRLVRVAKAANAMWEKEPVTPELALALEELEEKE